MRRDSLPFDTLDLLVLWWRVENGWLPVEGFPHECPSTAGFRTSRQYDDHNGAQETDARGQLAEAVGRVVNGLAEPYRTALYVLARNRATGVQVWVSARLPQDQDERARTVARAIELFESAL